MNVIEIINIIHQQGVENEVFELLTQWMIEDRYNKMLKIGESKSIIRAINKIATQNKNAKQAIDGIISLSESEVQECKELMTDINGDTVYAVRMSDIRNLPPITPQPKTGHWIDDKCSVCGKGIEDLIASPEWYRDEKPNFCPFCGAVMKGEANGK